MTRYRLALAPDGAAAIVSDRVPGVVPGEGDLVRWTWAPGAFGDAWCADFEAVNRACRRANRGRSRDPIGEYGT